MSSTSGVWAGQGRVGTPGKYDGGGGVSENLRLLFSEAVYDFRVSFLSLCSLNFRV